MKTENLIENLKTENLKFNEMFFFNEGLAECLIKKWKFFY